MITNTIIWDNYPSEIYYYYGDPIAHITYSDVKGGYFGTGNINSNPLFVSAESGDYHLRSNSPCIDMGKEVTESTLSDSPWSAMNEDTTEFIWSEDIDGDSRPQCQEYDIGADEYPGCFSSEGENGGGGRGSSDNSCFIAVIK